MKHILIVDDNLTNLEQISIQIEDLYDVSLAKSGAQAIQICGKATPDLILLDIEMPEMDGFATLAKLREDAANSAVPVIFLTASHDVKTELKAIRAGAADFIGKPVEHDILVHRIETHLALTSAASEVDAKARQLEDAIITSFADIIEHRNANSFGGSRRSSRVVRALAEELLKTDAFPGQLNGQAIDMMVRAAPLHDIGKIGISDLILLKPSLLNDDEFRVMKTHAAIGAQILRKAFKEVPRGAGFQDFAVTMALSHHERWDGKGYPDGLAGEGIPFCARVMAVADVFDALLDTRAYKEPLCFAEAAMVISGGRGTVFDPRVVDAFQAAQSRLSAEAEGGKPAE
ncbi:MAG: response regulator [Deltaproteobacteria bacterium]|jgi:putative two-component system response regulator|nr:response regulator [Deltaproteobacteria bacterium]